MNKKILSMLLAVGMVFSMTACGTSSDSANGSSSSSESAKSSDASTMASEDIDNYVYTGDNIEIHLGDINSQFPLNLAYNLGYLQDEFKGSNVTFTMDYFQNGPAISEAFASGNLDFAEFGEQAAISGISAGYGYKIIGRNCDTETMYPLVVSKKIESVDDLKGAKIAVTLGTSAHYLLLSYLDAIGLSEDDIQLVNTTDTVTLLASGEVDGAADQLAKFNSLISSKDAYVFADGTKSNTCQISAFVGRNQFCEEHPEITAKILRAVQKVDDWMAESDTNQKEAFAKLASITQRDEEWFSTMYSGSNFGINLTEQDETVLSQVLKFMQQRDLLSNPDITIDNVIDDSYLKLAGYR